MVHDLFSKRQRQLRGEFPDVFTYIELPGELRIQIIHQIRKICSIGYFSLKREELFEFICTTLREERGVFQLCNTDRRLSYGEERPQSDEAEVIGYFRQEPDIEKALDVVEMFFRYSRIILKNENYYNGWEGAYEQIVDNLNKRFLEHGVGYSFEADNIIRMDNKYVHEEIIKPVLHLLSAPEFKSADEEYRQAHEHYRHERYKECLVSCCKSFESTMKIICSLQSWAYNEGDSSSRLIDVVVTHDLIPAYLLSHFSALRSCLESGIPTVRNRIGGHGQGPKSALVPSYLARYLLSETAASICLLVQAHNIGRS